MTLERLKTILARYPQLVIGLIGDLFLDRYLEIEPDVHELSIETGLEAYQVTRVRNSPGALGTVISNLVALGVRRLLPVTVIGNDGHGYDLRRELERLSVEPRYITSDAHRLTPTYTKPLQRSASLDWQELHRLDVRTRGPLSDTACQSVCENLREVFSVVDGLVVLDQINEPNWGVVNQQVRETLWSLSRDLPEKPILIDSRRNLAKFNFGILKGNQREITAAAGLADEPSSTHAAAEQLVQRTGRTVYCTLGEQGILVARRNGASQLVSARPVEGPRDIVGAGDSATSGIVASLLSGADEIEAATIGNLVASITVQQIGTTGTATRQEVVDRWNQLS